jgi:hypothetical protein
MNRFRWLLAGSALTAVVGLAALDSSAQAQTGGKTATLKGKVTFDGTPPPKANILAKFAGHQDANHCAKGDTEDLTWVVDPATKGVANAVVFLKFASPPKYDFKATGLPAEVDIDQPFCAFKPHVSVVDVKDQKLIVKNSAPITHNTRMEGSRIKNPPLNRTLPAGKHEQFAVKSDNVPLRVNCDVHKWMEGYVWAFDHPFAAVTKEDGTFEIKGIAPGPVKVVVWHEPNFFHFGSDGKAMTLKEGDNTLDEVKLKK